MLSVIPTVKPASQIMLPPASLVNLHTASILIPMDLAIVVQRACVLIVNPLILPSAIIAFKVFSFLMDHARPAPANVLNVQEQFFK